MGLRSKLRVKRQDVVKASKEGKTREIRVTVFPAEGGRPYVADVAVDEQGIFELEDVDGSFRVARDSVWQEGSTLRAIVNEANPQTVSAATLVGDDIMSPQAFHGVAENNLWVQLDTISRRKNWQSSAATWGIMALCVGILLLVLWQIKTIGDGFESLEAAIRTINTAAGGSTHQPISPGGR